MHPRASKLLAALVVLVLCLGPVPLAGAQESAQEGSSPPLSLQLYGGPDADGAQAGDLVLPAQIPAGTFTPAGCLTALPAGAGPEDVRCGHVSVPVDHDDPAGATIQLAVAVRIATGPDPVDDPLLVLGGGPGEHLVAAFPVLLGDGTPLATANVDRDVILLDQRGVGFSRPALDCPEVLELTDSSTDAFTSAMLACRARLVAGGIDLSAYDTQNNVQDLDIVREALGYDAWNIFGTSYGARLALQAGRAHPTTIRSQVLSSPVPAEENFIADVATSFDTALDRLGEACAADAACAGSVGGDLVDTVDEVLERLDERPARTDVTDPATGQATTVPVTDELVATVLFQLFYSGAAIPVIPALVAEMADGDYRSTVEVLSSAQPRGRLISSQGMQLSFMCAEEIADSSREEVDAAPESVSRAPQVLLESHPVVGLPVFDLCELWDVEPADPITFTPVETGPPALLVTGTYDQITPPEYGEAVHASLPTSHLVEVPDQGHSPLLPLLASECGARILDEFLADPEAVPDASCATSRSLELTPELPATPRVRATSDACPPGLVPPAAIPDVDPANVHLPQVRCMAWWQIVQPAADGTYQPAEPVAREQMASFTARLIQQAGGTLPLDPPDAFVDDNGSVHEQAINQLAALGILHGHPDGTFRPGEAMTRAQVGTVLADVLITLLGDEVPLPEADYFADDAGSVHEANINLLAEAGIAGGQVDAATRQYHYRPEAPMPRDQVASLLARTLDLFRERGFAQALPTLPPPTAGPEPSHVA